MRRFVRRSVLCGTMFPGLRVIRHRLFETSFPLPQPNHIPHAKHPLVHTRDKRKNHYGKTCEWNDFVQVTGGGNCSVAAARDAMGIDWMTKKEINESIPPPYTEYVGRQIVRHLNKVAHAEQSDACGLFTATPLIIPTSPLPTNCSHPQTKQLPPTSPRTKGGKSVST